MIVPMVALILFFFAERDFATKKANGQIEAFLVTLDILHKQLDMLTIVS